MNDFPTVRFIAPNHCTIRLGHGIFFQSYDSVCAFRNNNGQIILYEDWDYSRTTLKYLKEFLNTRISKKEIQEKLNSGIFTKGY